MDPLELGFARLALMYGDRPWALRPSMSKGVAQMAGAMPADVAAQFEARSVALTFRERMGSQRVANVDVIPVQSVITQRMSFMTWWFGGTALEWLREAITESLNDPEVGAVVLDIDSPGGSVDGLPEFAAWLRSVRDGDKPIAAVARPYAASAAIWVAASATELVVTPSGSVGSVGVYSLHWDISRELEMLGEDPTFIYAGEHKVEGNPYEPLTDEAQADIQHEVDHYFGLFQGDMAKGRRTTVSHVAEAFGDGRMLLPQEALDAGLVDRIDTLEGTVRRLAKGRPASTSRGRAADDHPEPVASDQAPEPEPTGSDSQPQAEPTPIRQPDATRVAAAAFDRQVRGAPAPWFREETTAPWN